MGLIKIYKKTAFTSRLIAFFVAIGFGSLLAWYYHVDVFLTIGVISAVAVFAEAVVFHPKFTLVSILTAVQVIVVSVTSMILFTSIEAFSNTANALYVSTGLQAVGLAAVLLTLLGNYLFSAGRLWVNTLASYVLYNATLLTLILSRIDMSYVISALIAFAVIIAYICVRHFVSLRKEAPFDVSEVKTQPADTAFTSNFVKQYPEFEEYKTENLSNRISVFYNDKNVFVVATVTPEKYFTIIKNDAWLDQEVVTGMLEYIVNEAVSLSRNLKINQKLFVPILHVTTNSQLPKSVTTIKIRSRRYPERIIGKLFIVNKDGLRKLIKTYEATDNKLPEKALKTLTVS